jgi:L-threonylcarbamoyladenylate synthase
MPQPGPTSTVTLKADTACAREEALRAAVETLRAGQVVALPTETVYGLAANALDPAAVRRIYEIKGRPSHNPIIVHVASIAMARACVVEWPKVASALAAAFWPGPLTMVLRKSAQVPDVVTAGSITVAVRWSRHPLMQEVITRCGFPLAAPSANQSGRISPTTATHVKESLGGLVPLIIDGGEAEVGIESTVLDLSVIPPKVLRPGMIHSESLAAVAGDVAEGPSEEGGLLRSPGLLLKHYAPRARLVIWNPSAVLEIRKASGPIHVLCRNEAPAGVQPDRVAMMSRDPTSFARALYAELHRCDASGAALIIVEAVPDEPAWQGIADRLRRASAAE